MIFQKWYYNLALLFYPILAIGWFIPKAVLRKGKMYLFLRYVNYIFNLIKNFKFTVLHFGLLIFAIFTPIIVDGTGPKYFSICAFSYFYIGFIARYIRNSFQPAQLFGANVEQFLDELSKRSKKNESFLITTFVLNKDKDEDLTPEKVTKGLKRLIMVNYVLTAVIERLNGFRGKRAFVIALMYELFIFLATSILFFWTCNYLLFKANPVHYQISGIPNTFDFLYYSIKTIVFSDIDAIKPESWVAKIFEVFAFLVIGIFLLIIVISMFFSLRNDKINENVKLTTEFFNDQNRVINEFAISTFGKDLNTAMTEIANINDSLLKIKNIMDKLF